MLISYPYKTLPFAHQKELLAISSEREYFAYLMEQGTGKSKPIVDNAAMLYMAGKIDCLIIVAPNGVHRKWLKDDIPKSLPDEIRYRWAVWQSTSISAEKAVEVLFAPGDVLRIITLNVEAFSGNAKKTSTRVPKGVQIVRRLTAAFRCMFVIDESQTIKESSSSRTENIIDLGIRANYRRILSGTASPEAPLNLFSQFKFLSPRILGTSFFAFKPEYAELLPATSPLILKMMRDNPKLRMAPQVVATDPVTGRPLYKNLDRLKERIQPHSYRKTKAECFDLPEKIYTKRYFEMERAQQKLYDSLRSSQKAFFENTLVTVVQKLTVLMRLSQLVRGYMVNELGGLTRLYEPKDNPSIKALLEALEERGNSQTIVWCRFQHEVRDVLSVLGGKAVDYYGPTSNEDRERNYYAFKAGEKQYFVGTVDAGGVGLDLNEIPGAIFYSNQFSAGKRQQAEDRNHRYGTKGEMTRHGHGVLYEDVVCPGSIDEYILKLLASKKEVSDYMMDLKVVYDV